MVTLAVTAFPRRGPPADVRPPAGAQPGAAPAPAVALPDAGPPRDGGEASGPVPAPHPSTQPRRAPPQHPAPATAPPVPLVVHVRPYAQRALLDGVEIARDEQLVTVAVPPGRHELRIEHACCAPFVRELTAEDAAAAGELRVPLEPRPARLRVDGDPATRIFVNGIDAGTAGDSQHAPIAVPVPPGGASPYEGVAHVRLELVGAPPTEVTVRIRAGESFTVAAPQPGSSGG